MRTLRLRLLGALGVLAILALLAGVPVILLAIGATPIPHHFPTWQGAWNALSRPDDGHLLLVVFAVLAWAAWLFLAVAVLVEIAFRLRGVSAPRLPGLTLPQGMARGLVSAAALLFTLPLATQVASAAPPTAPPISHATPHTTHATQTSRPTVAKATTQQAERSKPEQRTINHTVRPGETLWSIAEQHLGDGARYKQIAHLNYYHRQPDGGELTSSHWIQPGWQLKVPAPHKDTADHVTASADKPNYTVKPGDTLWQLADDKLGDGDRYVQIVKASRDIEQPGGDQLTEPDEIRPGWDLRIPDQRPLKGDTKTSHQTGSSHKSSDDHRAKTTTPRTEKPTQRPSQQTQATTAPPTTGPTSTPSASTTQQPPQPSESVAPTQTTDTAPHHVQADDENADWVVRTAGGVGAVLAVGVLGLVATRRRAQQRRRRHGQTLPMPAPAAAEVEEDLRTTADPLSVETVDVALRTLARNCAEKGTPLPVVRAARLTADQFDLYLAEPAELPAPWSGTADTSVWSIDATDADTDAAADLTDIPAPYPALVTIGHDIEGGHVFLDLEYLGVLHLAGDPRRTQEVIAAVAVELATSQWADNLQVTLVGAYPELEDALQTGRIRYLPSVGHVLDELARRADEDRAALTENQTADLQQARVTGAAPDAWSPEIVILAGPITSRQRNQLETLIDQLPRVAIAALTTDTQIGEWSLELTDGDDLATLSPIGLQLRPQRIDEAAYTSILEMITLTEVDAEPTNPADVEPEITLADLDQLAATPDTATTDEPDTQQETQEPEPAAPSPAPAEAVDDEAAPAPLIQVLGPVDLLHPGGRVEDTKRNRLLEFAAYLALNPGSSHTAIDDALWPDRKSDDNLNTRNTATSKLRSWVGKTPGGEDYLPRHQSGGGYRFLPAVRTDWDLWTELLPGGPVRGSTECLEQALELVRGRPFDGAHPRRYAWAEPIRQRMISEIVDASYELARRRLMQGRWRAAEQAVVIGLAIEPALERLWRLRILAAHESRNAAATKEAIARLLAITDELGGDLETETENLLAAVQDPNRELDQQLMAGAL